MNKNIILAIVVGFLLVVVVGAYFLNDGNTKSKMRSMNMQDEMTQKNEMMMRERQKQDMQNAELEASINLIDTTSIDMDIEADMSAIDKAI